MLVLHQPSFHLTAVDHTAQPCLHGSQLVPGRDAVHYRIAGSTTQTTAVQLRLRGCRTTGLADWTNVTLRLCLRLTPYSLRTYCNTPALLWFDHTRWLRAHALVPRRLPPWFLRCCSPVLVLFSTRSSVPGFCGLPLLHRTTQPSRV